MKMGILALICIHMLLWAGCQSTPVFRKLRSDENLLREAIDSTQPYRGSWRKLLEENSTNADAIKEGTANVRITTAPKTADEKNVTAQIAGKADVRDVEKDSVAVDAKKEEVKEDPAPTIALKKAGESEGGAAQDNANKVEEPKGDVNAQVLKEEQTKLDLVEESDTHILETVKVEVKVESTAQSQAIQREEKPTTSTKEDDTKAGVGTEKTTQQTSEKILKEAEGKDGEVASTEKVPSKQSNPVETKDASNVNRQHSNVVTLDKDTQDKAPESVKEESLPAIVTEKDKGDSTPEHADETLDEAKTSEESDSQDNPAKERSDLEEKTDSKEELAEANSIKMVETTGDLKERDSRDADKAVQTTDTEGAGAHENARAIGERTDNPSNSTDGPNEETSKTDDTKVEDEKVEEHELNASIEIKEEESENVTEVSEVQSDDEKVEEKQELIDDSKQSEGNDTERDEEKAEELSDDGNTESKEDESEDSSDTEDISLVAKSDDESEAATKEVELQLEALKRDSVIETTVEQAQERDPSEDEYDIIQELADLPTKFHETAGKVADHLRPDVIKWTDTSKVYFNLANQHITDSFSPLIGKQYAPFIASMISYSILLLPLIVVILLFDHIKALFSLQKVLLFVNIYLAAYFATLWLASFIIGLEPMSFFYVNSLSSYLSLQLLQALGYVVYLILQTANVIYSCTSDTLVGKVTSVLQWGVAMGIGLHYYVTVFHPAIASKPPHTSWKFYAMYTAAFFILCLFARIRWVKKQYVTSGSKFADKKS